MKLLIDTCVLLWMARERGQLSIRAQTALADPSAELFVSAMSAFELAIKAGKGKLTLPKAPIAWFEDAVRIHGLVEIPVSSRIAAASCDIVLPHRDPCDRILVAIAGQLGMSIVTSDQLVRAYADVGVIW